MSDDPLFYLGQLKTRLEYLRELGLLGRNQQIASQRVIATDADRMAVNARNDGL